MADLVVKSRADLRAAVRRLAAAAAGRGDPAAGTRIAAAAAEAAQEQVAADFARLSAGGGTSWRGPWPALSPRTVAARPPQPPLRPGANPRRPLLSESQDARWRAIYAGLFSRLRVKVGAGEAARVAAAVAWARLKAEGAKTKLGTLGTRDVELLRVSGRLADSLGPGGGPDKVFEAFAGGLAVGSALPYADRQFATRPWHPEGGASPETLAAVGEAVRDAVRGELFGAVAAGRV